jgi:hypothetical protein
MVELDRNVIIFRVLTKLFAKIIDVQTKAEIKARRLQVQPKNIKIVLDARSQRVIDLMHQGFYVTKVAQTIGVSRSTVYRDMEKISFSEFTNSIIFEWFTLYIELKETHGDLVFQALTNLVAKLLVREILLGKNAVKNMTPNRVEQDLIVFHNRQS